MYPSGLTITPEPRPCSVCLPCLCGARPPKNWRKASSESENPVCPRETVCVVNTVTTLGATFSTTGAKVVIIPSRVCGGCYAGAKHAVPTKNNVASTICVSDRGVSLRIKHSCLQKRIARWRDIGSLFVDACATGVERAVVNAFERGIGQVFRQPARGNSDTLTQPATRIAT